MSAIEERISDRLLLKLLRAMLRSGVMQDEAVMHSDAGTPQGGVVSPTLCNVYLHRLDRCWAERGAGMLVRFADDLVVMCHSAAEAERALAALRAILAEHGLTLKEAKTRIVELREGGEGLDFLGFHHRWVRGNTPASRHLCFLIRWPRREKMQHARNRMRELTLRKRLLLPVDEVVADLNEYLRGFASYFRYGNSARSFGLLDEYAIELALFLAKRHKKKRGYGYWRIARSPDRMGLIRITGTDAYTVDRRPARHTHTTSRTGADDEPPTYPETSRSA